MLFQLLAGRTPFNGDEKAELFDRIRAYTADPSQLEFPASIPDSARDLVERLLHPDPAQRIAADGDFGPLRRHPFFGGVDWDNLAAATPPKVEHGGVAASEIESKLRQRKYSM